MVPSVAPGTPPYRAALAGHRLVRRGQRGHDRVVQRGVDRRPVVDHLDPYADTRRFGDRPGGVGDRLDDASVVDTGDGADVDAQHRAGRGSRWPAPGRRRAAPSGSGTAGRGARAAGAPRPAGSRRSASATTTRAATGIGLRPCCGIAPCAIAPVSSIVSRTAPLAVAHTSPSSGSQTMTPSISPGSSSRQVRAKCFAPSISPSSSASAATTSRPGNGPLSCTARTACSMAASPDFMSARAPAPDPAVAQLGAERVDGPPAGVALGDHVGVAREHQGPAGTGRPRPPPRRWAGRERPR